MKKGGGKIGALKRTATCVGESQSNGIIAPTVELVAGQARILKAAWEHHRIGVRVPPDARILCWLVEFAALSDEKVRHR